MQKVKQERNSLSIEFQISALEKKLQRPGANLFPIKGKIKKLKKELEDAKREEWLGQ